MTHDHHMSDVDHVSSAYDAAHVQGHQYYQYQWGIYISRIVYNEL